MALFDTRLPDIGEAQIQSLIENEVRENYRIEYKRSVSLKDKQDKIDFLAGLTSFANSNGGDMVIGVACKDGVPVHLSGWEGVNLDEEKQRIENLLRDAVEPRLTAVLHEVRLSAAPPALVIRIPRSWAQPHMVKIDQVNRFYYRHSAGKAIMDVAQLRSAFSLSAELPAQVEEFRTRRMLLLKSGSLDSLTAPAEPTAVLHIVPFDSLRPGKIVSLEAAIREARYLAPLGTSSNGSRFNLDGILTWSEWTEGRRDAYTQLFRNGIVESADRHNLKNGPSQKFIPSTLLINAVLQKISDILAMYRHCLEIPPPAALTLTLINVREFELATNQRDYFRLQRIDREDVVLPAVLVEDFTLNPVEIARPLFDALWNAGGFARWFDYERYLEWKPD